MYLCKHRVGCDASGALLCYKVLTDPQYSGARFTLQEGFFVCGILRLQMTCINISYLERDSRLRPVRLYTRWSRCNELRQLHSCPQRKQCTESRQEHKTLQLARRKLNQPKRLKTSNQQAYRNKIIMSPTTVCDCL